MSSRRASGRGRRASRSNRTAAAVLAPVVIACAAIAGCGGNGESSGKPGTARANPHYGAPGATVRFVSPRRRVSLRGPVRVEVRVRGFRLERRGVGKPPRRGFGQLHFRMDGGRYDKPRYSGANGALAARLGVAGRYSVAAAPRITYRGLPAGRHTLVVALANNDLSEVGVQARTSFTMVRGRRRSGGR